MMLVLTGPTGSGKTDTSWALLALMNGAVFLDCDWFASRSGFDWNDAAEVDSVYRAMVSQLAFHVADRRHRFVLTLTLEMARIFEVRRADVARFSPVAAAIRLTCAPDLLTERIRSRGRDQHLREIADARLQAAVFDTLFPSASVFTPINTSHRSPDMVAAMIMKHARA